MASRSWQLASHSRLPRTHDRLGAMGELQLAEDVRDVVTNGLSAQEQPARNCIIGMALCYQVKELTLPLGQLRKWHHRLEQTRRGQACENAVRDGRSEDYPPPTHPPHRIKDLPHSR